MSGLLIRLFVFVAVLLGVASISLASDCASDPNECTPKGLCEVATEVTDGNKLWSTSTTSTKHVSFAQKLGMNCGVVELKDTCDTDPNECKINQLCEKATIDDAGTKSWNSEAAAYVEIAKEYGLECGIYKQQKKVPMLQGDNCLSNPARCNDTSLCTNSTRTSHYEINYKRIRVWENAEKYQVYVNEAKKRGLTCAVNAKFDPCYFDLSACENQFLCKIAVEPTGEWKNYDPFADEAKRRGLTCGVGEKPKSTLSSNYEQNATVRDFKQAFISQSQLKRKQLQYALKELRFYTYGVDGLWGKGTKKGFERFVKWGNLEGRGESAVFTDLLSPVVVPTSFAAPKKTVTTTTKTTGWVPLAGTPKLPFEDAKEVCEAKGLAEGNTYMSNNRPSRRRSGSFSCNTIGSFTSCGEISGGWAAGALKAMDNAKVRNAAKKLAKSVAKACMAEYGWIKR